MAAAVETEHVCTKERDIDEIKGSVKNIEKLLMGNGVVGIAEMARRAFQRTEEMRASKNGTYDWAFRIVVGIILSYIAAKVGLK